MVVNMVKGISYVVVQYKEIRKLSVFIVMLLIGRGDIIVFVRSCRDLEGRKVIKVLNSKFNVMRKYVINSVCLMYLIMYGLIINLLKFG